MRRWTINPCRECGNHQTAFALCAHQRDDEGDDWREQSPDTEVVAVSDLQTAIGELRDSRAGAYNDTATAQFYNRGYRQAISDLASRLDLDRGETD